MELYYSFKIFMPIIVICLIIGYVVVAMIQHKFNLAFRQNCFKCKHYNLIDVPTCGGDCKRKCMLKGRYDYLDMNTHTKFVKCKEFEEEPRSQSF